MRQVSAYDQPEARPRPARAQKLRELKRQREAREWARKEEEEEEEANGKEDLF